jgi:hypothetical protein
MFDNFQKLTFTTENPGISLMNNDTGFTGT